MIRSPYTPYSTHLRGTVEFGVSGLLPDMRQAQLNAFMPLILQATPHIEAIKTLSCYCYVLYDPPPAKSPSFIPSLMQPHLKGERGFFSRSETVTIWNKRDGYLADRAPDLPRTSLGGAAGWRNIQLDPDLAAKALEACLRFLVRI